jgi:peptidoglycan L-alanyl-D-glutamate endopeptidase CwlK
MGVGHYWGTTSLERIDTLDPRWKGILDDVLVAVPFDVKVIWGYRGQEVQDRAYAEGKSTKQWPNSVHNKMPSRAVDLAPVVGGEIPWDDPRPWLVLAGAVLGVARVAREGIRWGGNWDSDAVMLDDQDFDDLGHFEIAEGDD